MDQSDWKVKKARPILVAFIVLSIPRENTVNVTSVQVSCVQNTFIAALS